MIRNSALPITNAVTSYIVPEIISANWEPLRDFAFAKLNQNSKSQNHMKNICSVVHSVTLNKMVLVVCTVRGLLFVFDIDEKEGGECVLDKQYSIIDPEVDL